MGGESEWLQSFLQETRFARKETSVQSVLQSRTLLEKVIGDLGLCIEEKKQRFSIPRRLQVVKDRFCAEMGRTTQDARAVHFSHAVCDIDTPTDLYIQCDGEDIFTVCNAQKERITEGKTGERITVPFGSFVITWMDSSCVGKEFAVRVYPIAEKVKEIGKG